MDSSLDNNKDLSFSEKIKTYSIFILKKISIYLLILIIAYIIEYLLYKLLLQILKFLLLSIIFQIILHLLFLRYLVLKVAFAGLSFFITRNIQYKRGKMQASYLYRELLILKSSFALLFDELKPIEEIKYFYTLQRNIKSSFIVIKHFYDIFHKMKEKFNELTIDQNNFYEYISKLKNLLEKAEILKFLNDIIIKLREDKITNINHLAKEKKNKILERKNNIQKILEINSNNYTNYLISQLEDYIGEKYPVYSMRYIRNYFSNLLFASLNQFDIELHSYYIYEQKSLLTKDGSAKLDYIIINHNTGKKQKIKKLMIICGPNAEPYQIFARNLPLDLYLNKGIDVLCWNYRGYGYSTGKANFDNLREDIMEIYREIKKSNKYEKIGVHGISIGGIPSCHLAGNVQDIKLLVSDRNFGQIEYIAKSCYLGKYLVFLYNLLFMQNSRNVENYLNAKGLKIILNDPCDEIVTEEGSLKSMISEKLCKEYIYKINSEDNTIELDNLEGEDTLDNTNVSIKNNNNIYNDNQIEIEDDDNNNDSPENNIINKNISLNSYNKSNYNPINLNTKITNNLKKSKNLTMLDILLSSEKNLFISSIINISNFLSSEESSEIQSNLFDFIDTKISLILQNFKSAGDTLHRITKINDNKYNQTLFIENFFNNLFIWGTYDKLDEYGGKYNSTEFIEIMIEKSISSINSFLNSEEIINTKNMKIIKDIEMFYNYLNIIKNEIKLIVVKTPKGFAYLNEGEKFENELNKLGRGNLVTLTCGHNGLLSEEENIVFKYYLNKSELFTDDKEDNEINYINNDNKISDVINNEVEDLDTSFDDLTKTLNDN